MYYFQQYYLTLVLLRSNFNAAARPQFIQVQRHDYVPDSTPNSTIVKKPHYRENGSATSNRYCIL